MRKNKILNIGILCMALVLTTISLTFAAPIELTYSHMWVPEYRQAREITNWADKINKLSQGRVKITVYPANTLTTAAECYQGVVRGTADIGAAVMAYSPGRFPLMAIRDLPVGQLMNTVANSRISNELFKKFKPAELNDVHVLYFHTWLPGAIISNKPVYKLEDLKGLKIRASGVSNSVAAALGAVPVSMSADAVYDALWKGTLDGAWGTPNMLEGFRYAEVAKYSTLAGKAGYTGTFVVAMNKKKWNSLPPDIQEIFNVVSEIWIDKTGQAWMEMEWKGYQYAKEKGHTFISLSPEEEEKWLNAIEPVIDNYTKREAKEAPIKEALVYIKQLADEYIKLYPPIKFE